MSIDNFHGDEAEQASRVYRKTQNLLDGITERDRLYDEAEKAAREVEEAHKQRADECLSELLDVRTCLAKGTLDHLAASGILTEYLDFLIGCVRKESK